MHTNKLSIGHRPRCKTENNKTSRRKKEGERRVSGTETTILGKI